MLDQHIVALVVDDDPLIALSTADILTASGFLAIDAQSPAQALGLMNRYAGQIRLMITDVQMPNSRDGFDLAREVSNQWPEVKIVVMSGLANPADNDLPTGSSFIRKPFSSTALIECIRSVVL